MCKLCNIKGKERKARDIKYYGKRALVRKEFARIVYQYTEGFPCEKCLTTYIGHISSIKSGLSDFSIDTYIIDKLYKSYICQVDNYRRNYAKFYGRITHATKIEKERIALRVCRNIRVTINSKTSHQAFTVIKTVNKKSVRKNFGTLKEALEFRDKLE